jgi:hypothetical protein
VPLLVGRYEGLRVELLGPLAKLGLVGLFNSGLFTVSTQCGRFYRLLYIAVCGNQDFTFHLLFLAFDTLAPTPSLL